jgi:hypothetical protein
MRPVEQLHEDIRHAVLARLSGQSDLGAPEGESFGRDGSP